MEPLRKRLCEAVAERLQEDGVVIVVRRLKLGHLFVQAMPRRHHKQADMVAQAAPHGGHKIGEGVIRPTGGLLHLLAQAVDALPLLGARRVGVDHNIIPRAGRWEQANHPFGR